MWGCERSLLLWWEDSDEGSIWILKQEKSLIINKLLLLLCVCYVAGFQILCFFCSFVTFFFFFCCINSANSAVQCSFKVSPYLQAEVNDNIRKYPELSLFCGGNLRRDIMLKYTTKATRRANKTPNTNSERCCSIHTQGLMECSQHSDMAYQILSLFLFLIKKKIKGNAENNYILIQIKKLKVLQRLAVF